MNVRPVEYYRLDPDDAVLAANFVTLECVPEGWLHHAVTVPRAWSPIAPLPIDPDAGAPMLASLVLEDPALGERGAGIVCAGLSRAVAPTAREVVERLAAREGMVVGRWNDEDAEIGGIRAMLLDDRRLAAVRVLPLAEDSATGLAGWVYVCVAGPQDRADEYGGALHHALMSFRVHPHARWMNA